MSANALLAEVFEAATRLRPLVRNGRGIAELQELRLQIRSLALSDLHAFQLTRLLVACGRAQIKDAQIWEPASKLLASRLNAAEVHESALVSLTHAYATTSVRSDAVLRCIVPAVIERAQGGEFVIEPQAAARLARYLGKTYAAYGVVNQKGRWRLGAAMYETTRDAGQRGAFSLPDSKQLASVLEARIAGGIAELQAAEIAEALAGLAALAGKAEALATAAHSRLLLLLDQQAIDVNVACMLIRAYGALRYRDTPVLQALLEYLAAAASKGQLVSAGNLARVVHACTVTLRPALPSFAPVVATSLPKVVHQLEMQQLIVVVTSLGFVPGLEASRVGLGSAAFGAVMAMPISSFPSDALVAILRSAWVLRYRDVDFWTVLLREVTKRVESESATFATGASRDILGMSALLAARVIAAAGNSDHPVGLTSELAPPLQACRPAAEDLLQAVSELARLRCAKLSPREVGIFAISMAKAGFEDGGLFAAIAHRAMELLSSQDSARGRWKFGSKDSAQLLAGLARFQFADEPLLEALALHIERDFDSYDKLARRIILVAWSKLGGLPEGTSCPLQAEALLEYELTHGRATDRSGPHLDVLEIEPMLESEAMFPKERREHQHR
mmetsp:Transcript_44631/g.105841  ORF Transcript_44631/g.105841 Transcript_44631/m.105841 type:complete len:617 (-) Transcript_44631:121-1971(-)